MDPISRRVDAHTWVRLAAVLLTAAALAVGAAAKGKVRKLDARELVRMRAAGQQVIVVDTRGGEVEYKVPGAEQVTLDELDEWAEPLDRATPIVVYCT